MESTFSINRIEFYYDDLKFLYGEMHVDSVSDGIELINIINISDIKYNESSYVIKFIKSQFQFEYKISKDKIIKKTFNFDDVKPSGYDKNSKIETKDGPKKIFDLTKDDKIYNSSGQINNLNSILIFNVSTKSKIFNIKIEENKCGIQIPREDFSLSINSNLRLKKQYLSGRQLYLSKKASKINSNNYFNKFYNLNINQLTTDTTFLINGFIVENFNLKDL